MLTDKLMDGTWSTYRHPKKKKKYKNNRYELMYVSRQKRTVVNIHRELHIHTYASTHLPNIQCPWFTLVLSSWWRIPEGPQKTCHLVLSTVEQRPWPPQNGEGRTLWRGSEKSRNPRWCRQVGCPCCLTASRWGCCHRQQTLVLCPRYCTCTNGTTVPANWNYWIIAIAPCQESITT